MPRDSKDSQLTEDLPVGGQAVIEGVMIRAEDKVVTAVRTPEQQIVVREEQPLIFIASFVESIFRAVMVASVQVFTTKENIRRNPPFVMGSIKGMNGYQGANQMAKRHIFCG